MRRGIVGILLLGAVAVVAGLIGYQAGTASGAVAAGATVVVAGGFPWVGFFFLLFLMFFVAIPFFAFAGMRRGGHHGHGGPGAGGHGGPGAPWMRGGPGSWSGGGPGADDPRRQWIADVHRSLHEADAASGAPAATGGTAPGTTGA